MNITYVYMCSYIDAYIYVTRAEFHDLLDILHGDEPLGEVAIEKADDMINNMVVQRDKIKFEDLKNVHRKSPMKTCARSSPYPYSMRPLLGGLLGVAASAAAQPAGYGAVIPLLPQCLQSGQTISGEGTQQFCMDVPGPRTLGHKRKCCSTRTASRLGRVNLHDR